MQLFEKLSSIALGVGTLLLVEMGAKNDADLENCNDSVAQLTKIFVFSFFFWWAIVKYYLLLQKATSRRTLRHLHD